MSDELLIDSQSAIELPFDWKDTLLIGIGNDGRSDDGLGWAFCKALEQQGDFPGAIAYRYQLQIEDAEIISHVEHVVFVDACRDPLPNGFQLRTCRPIADVAFTSHQLSPQTVLYMCQQLYNKTPAAHLLAIEGSTWELQFGLSSSAKSNLAAALKVFKPCFRRP